LDVLGRYLFFYYILVVVLFVLLFISLNLSSNFSESSELELETTFYVLFLLLLSITSLAYLNFFKVAPFLLFPPSLLLEELLELLDELEDDLEDFRLGLALESLPDEFELDEPESDEEDYFLRFDFLDLSITLDSSLSLKDFNSIFFLGCSTTPKCCPQSSPSALTTPSAYSLS